MRHWKIVSQSGGRTAAEWTIALRRRALESAELDQAIRAWPILTEAGRGLLVAHPALTSTQRAALVAHWIRASREPESAATRPGTQALTPWGQDPFSTTLWSPEQAGALHPLAPALFAPWVPALVAACHPVVLAPMLRHPGCPESVRLEVVRTFAPRSRTLPDPRAVGQGGAGGGHDTASAQGDEGLPPPSWDWDVVPPARQLSLLLAVVRNPGWSSDGLARVCDALGTAPQGLQMLLEVLQHVAWAPQARSARVRQMAESYRLAGGAPAWASSALQTLLTADGPLGVRDRLRLLGIQHRLSPGEISTRLAALSRETHPVRRRLHALVVRRNVRQRLEDEIRKRSALPSIAAAWGLSGGPTGTSQLGGPEGHLVEHQVVRLVRAALLEPLVRREIARCWPVLVARMPARVLQGDLGEALTSVLATSTPAARRAWLRPLMASSDRAVREFGLSLWGAIDCGDDRAHPDGEGPSVPNVPPEPRD